MKPFALYCISLRNVSAAGCSVKRQSLHCFVIFFLIFLSSLDLICITYSMFSSRWLLTESPCSDDPSAETAGYEVRTLFSHATAPRTLQPHTYRSHRRSRSQNHSQKGKGSVFDWLASYKKMVLFELCI